MKDQSANRWKLAYRPRLERLEPRTVLSFLPPVPYSTGTTPTDPDVGDFNLDGKLDVVTSTCAEGQASVLLGNGDGTLQPYQEYPTGGPCPTSAAVADMNNDGIPDITTANDAGKSVGVLLGYGDGTFEAPIVAPMPNYVYDHIVRDFNGDGWQDAAAVNYTANRVFVLLGNGDGTLKHIGTLGTALEPIQIDASDFNHDGAVDLVVANQGNDSVSVYLGKGNGRFRPKVDYGSGGDFANGLSVADFNNDGNPDMVVSNTGSNRIGVLNGKGDGTFHAAVPYRVRRRPTGLTSADFNQDGFVDVAVSGQTDPTGAVTVLLNNQAGGFFVYSVHPMPQTFQLISGDLNADGYLDLVAETSGNRVRVLINDATWATPVPIGPSRERELSTAALTSSSKSSSFASLRLVVPLADHAAHGNGLERCFGELSVSYVLNERFPKGMSKSCPLMIDFNGSLSSALDGPARDEAGFDVL